MASRTSAGQFSGKSLNEAKAWTNGACHLLVPSFTSQRPTCREGRTDTVGAGPIYERPRRGARIFQRTVRVYLGSLHATAGPMAGGVVLISGAAS